MTSRKTVLTFCKCIAFCTLSSCQEKQHIVYGHAQVAKIMSDAGVGVDPAIELYAYVYQLGAGQKLNLVIVPALSSGKLTNEAGRGIGIQVIYERNESFSLKKRFKIENTLNQTEYIKTSLGGGYDFAKHYDGSYRVTITNEYSHATDVMVYIDDRE